MNRKGESLFECPFAMCDEHKTYPACVLVRFYFPPTVETLRSPYWRPAMLCGADRVTRDMTMHEQPSGLAAAVTVPVVKCNSAPTFIRFKGLCRSTFLP